MTQAMIALWVIAVLLAFMTLRSIRRRGKSDAPKNVVVSHFADPALRDVCGMLTARLVPSAHIVEDFGSALRDHLEKENLRGIVVIVAHGDGGRFYANGDGEVITLGISEVLPIVVDKGVIQAAFCLTPSV